MSESPEFSNEHFIEAALLASPEPLSIDQLQKAAAMRPGNPEVSKADVREALKVLDETYSTRGLELIEVASGFRIQVRADMGRELTALFEERPPRYSRAFFETLALIAYRQPITRGEIEDVRGVAVSSNIIRNMMEREWIRVVGHRDVPGKPAMFGTTKAFLDYFNLKTLDDLPSLAELTDIESLKIQLDLPTVGDGTGEKTNEEDAEGRGTAESEAAESAEETGDEAAVSAADDTADDTADDSSDNAPDDSEDDAPTAEVVAAGDDNKTASADADVSHEASSPSADDRSANDGDGVEAPETDDGSDSNEPAQTDRG